MNIIRITTFLALFFVVAHNSEGRMDQVDDRLKQLGITLPPPKKAVANYVGCKESGSFLFVSALVSDVRGTADSVAACGACAADRHA